MKARLEFSRRAATEQNRHCALAALLGRRWRECKDVPTGWGTPKGFRHHRRKNRPVGP